MQIAKKKDKCWNSSAAILALVGAWMLSGCGWLESLKRENYVMGQRLARIEMEQLAAKRQQENFNATVASNVNIVLGKLFCTDPRVQSFLRSCNSGDRAVACDEKMRESILTFMTSQRHVVVYLGDGKKRQDIIPPRKGMLTQLLKENRLLSTEYWIFANPASTNANDVLEAEARANQVVELIREIAKDMQNEIMKKATKQSEHSGAPIEDEPIELSELRNLRIHSPQVFKMRLSGSDIEPVLRRNNQIDRPIGRETKDLSKGIWVFRTDCGARS